MSALEDGCSEFDTRQPFEDWAKRKGYDVSKDKKGYRSGIARLAWMAWKASMATRVSTPLGYRLQPLGEFDAYQCVLHENDKLRKALRLAREYMSEAVDYGTPCAKRDAALVDEALAAKCTAAAQPTGEEFGMVFADREELADLVVREACETEPADPDDPETIKIRTHDLRWAALAAMIQACPRGRTHERVFTGPGYLEQTEYIDPPSAQDAQ